MPAVVTVIPLVSYVTWDKFLEGTAAANGMFIDDFG